MENFKAWMVRISSEGLPLAKFINTLSLLEYMGSRKIVKSQSAQMMSLDLLSHISEEVRHAEVLKKLSLKMSDNQLKTYSDEHLYCGAAARTYIQTVDHIAEELFGKQNAWISYLYTTLLLEERAKLIYPICGETIEPLGYTNVFKGILKEEDRHLEAILADLGVIDGVTEEKLRALKEAESQAFTQFLIQLDAALPATAANRGRITLASGF
jgi:hypothetical protein